MYAISEKPQEVPTINLMMTTSGDTLHFSFIKSVSALLYDQTKHGGRKQFCLRCLSSFTTKGILQKHEVACKGLNIRPMRTEMPKEGENQVFCQNVGNQHKVPFIIYVNLEAIIEKIKSSKGNPQKSYTGKKQANIYTACGYGYKVVKSDGGAMEIKRYHGENALEESLKMLLHEKERIREELRKIGPTRFQHCNQLPHL